jgi:hypothetical protein
MSTIDTKAALSDLARYEELVRGFGYPNDLALREVRSIIFRLRGIGLVDSYFLEKLHKMEQFAEIGFSTRKFAKYRNGAAQVQVMALGQAKTARALIVAERSEK